MLVATSLFNVAPSSRLVVARARGSARRLGRRLDLCYLLWPNPLVTDRSLMAGMRRLREEGLVAEVGVSDYDLVRWQAAEQHLGSSVLVNQAVYNLLRRDAEEALLPWAAADGRRSGSGPAPGHGLSIRSLPSGRAPDRILAHGQSPLLLCQLWEHQRANGDRR